MYDAIVLAGGAGSRLGGVDKAAIEVGGQTLLQRVLTATVDARTTIVVGPARDLPYGVLGICEEPPGGGPVAGLAAGMTWVVSPVVVVLACDLPFLAAVTVQRLVDALATDTDEQYDGARLVDETGRAQPLVAAYRAARLRDALARLEETFGTPMRELVGGLSMLDVEAARGQAWDCDTWADVSRARERITAHHVEET